MSCGSGTERYLISLECAGETIQVFVPNLETAEHLLNNEEAALQFLNKVDTEKFPSPGTLLETDFETASKEVPRTFDLEKLWSNTATIMLINLVKTYDAELNNGIKKYVWTKIAEEMTKKLNKPFTYMQVNTKWKGLVKTYKDLTAHNNSTGKNRKYWEYYEIMNDILFSKPEINPVAICNSYSGLKVRTKEGALEKSEDASIKPSFSGIPSTSTENTSSNMHKPYESTFAKRRRDRESAIEKRHQDKMQRLDKLQGSLDDLVNLLKNDKKHND